MKQGSLGGYGQNPPDPSLGRREPRGDGPSHPTCHLSDKETEVQR